MALWSQCVAERITQAMMTTTQGEPFVSVLGRLADAAGCSIREVVNALWIEPGTLTVEHVARFADALGVGVGTFFEFTGIAQ